MCFCGVFRWWYAIRVLCFCWNKELQVAARELLCLLLLFNGFSFLLLVFWGLMCNLHWSDSCCRLCVLCICCRFFVDDGNDLLLLYKHGEKEENMYFVVVNGFVCRYSRDNHSSGCNLMRRRCTANQSTCILLFVWRSCSGGLLGFEHRHRAQCPWQCCGSRLNSRVRCYFFVWCLRIRLEGDVAERPICRQCKWDPQVCGFFGSKVEKQSCEIWRIFFYISNGLRRLVQLLKEYGRLCTWR